MNSEPHECLQILGGRALIISTESIKDERGSLTPLHFENLGFRAQRIAIINSKDGMTRGGHAHATGSQVLVCVSGSVEVEMRYEGSSDHVVLHPGVNALLIHSQVWARQTYRGDAPCLILMSDGAFSLDNYVHME